jgi:hypothetical protein
VSVVCHLLGGGNYVIRCGAGKIHLDVSFILLRVHC